MATEILQKTGTPIVFAASDFSDTVSGFTRTHDLDMDALADAAAEQSIRADLTATRAASYSVRAGFEPNAAPTAGAAIYIYWSSSFSGTAGVGNDGFCTGVEGAYTGSEDGAIADSVKLLTLIGVFTLEVDFEGDSADSVQIQTVGRFTPQDRYGQVVVWNESGQALQADGVEHFVALVPIIDESQ